MNFKLKIEPKDLREESFGPRRFSIAVVDLDRSKSYPQNFVCMLPVRIDPRDQAGSAFQRVFGNKSVEQAKALLTQALESEDDSDVRAEIERRLKLLEPKRVSLVPCSGCGKLFNPGYARRFRKKYCSECMAKKYGSRN